MLEKDKSLEIKLSRESDIYFRRNSITKTITEETIIESNNNSTDRLFIVREQKYLPEAKNSEEAYERLKEWSGQLIFENIKFSFLECNNYTLTTELMMAELQCINDFIKEAKGASTFKAFAPHFLQTKSKDNPYHEYLRIYEGFYKTTQCIYSPNGIAARIYAKYFLFKKWLEDQLNKIQQDCSNFQAQLIVSNKPKVIVIALYYYYLQETGVIPYFENFPRGKVEALNDIAQQYDISAKRLQLKYNLIQNSVQNRIAANQIQNIKAAITLLENHTDAQDLAKKELELAEKM